MPPRHSSPHSRSPSALRGRHCCFNQTPYCLNLTPPPSQHPPQYVTKATRRSPQRQRRGCRRCCAITQRPRHDRLGASDPARSVASRHRYPVGGSVFRAAVGLSRDDTAVYSGLLAGSRRSHRTGIATAARGTSQSPYCMWAIAAD